MARRSSGVVAPHTPSVTPFSRAQARHGVRAGQARQIRFASLIWRSAGPVAPIGKNRSGSAWRQAASLRQVARGGHRWGPRGRYQPTIRRASPGGSRAASAGRSDASRCSRRRSRPAARARPGALAGTRARCARATHRGRWPSVRWWAVPSLLLQWYGVGAGRRRGRAGGNLIGIACSVSLCAYEHRGGAGEQASSDCGDSAGRWRAWQAGGLTGQER